MCECKVFGGAAMRGRIEELEADNAKLCRWKVKYGQLITRLERDNAKLAKQVERLSERRDG